MDLLNFSCYAFLWLMKQLTTFLGSQGEGYIANLLDCTILEVGISAVVDLIYLIITELSTQLCAVFQDIEFSMD